jgi:hypothetical protein
MARTCISINRVCGLYGEIVLTVAPECRNDLGAISRSITFSVRAWPSSTRC